MSWHEIFGSIALLIGIVSYLPYWRGIIKGETKPHKFTWLIYFLLNGIAFFAMLTGGAGPGMWSMAFTTVNCLAIAIVGCWRGEKEITRSDWTTFAMALAIIPIWAITENAALAVVLVCIIDILGTWPTFRKSINKPWDEALPTYAMAIVNFIFALLAIENFTFVTSTYFFVLLFLDGSMTALLLIRRRVVPRPVQND